MKGKRWGIGRRKRGEEGRKIREEEGRAEGRGKKRRGEKRPRGRGSDKVWEGGRKEGQVNGTRKRFAEEVQYWERKSRVG